MGGLPPEVLKKQELHPLHAHSYSYLPLCRSPPFPQSQRSCLSFPGAAGENGQSLTTLLFFTRRGHHHLIVQFHALLLCVWGGGRGMVLLTISTASTLTYTCFLQMHEKPDFWDSSLNRGRPCLHSPGFFPDLDWRGWGRCSALQAL